MALTSKDQLLLAGVTYLRMGLSVIVVGHNKLPIHKWAQYQTRRMSEAKLFAQINRTEAYGIAIVGGSCSGNFVTYDIDEKNDNTGELYVSLVTKINQVDAGLLCRLPIAITPSKGHHFYYFTQRECSSSVIAKRIEPCIFTGGMNGNTYPVLIELRAKREYAIVPPTPGYAFVQGSFRTLPVLSENEHEELLSVGRSFGQTKAQPPGIYPSDRHPRTGSPLDDFDRRGELIQLLLQHGWSICPQSRDRKRIFLKRPGTTKNKTSANFHLDYNTFMVHSTSTIFISKKAYRPSAVYAILECNGDFRQAAKQLIQLGFGIPYKIQRGIGT